MLVRGRWCEYVRKEQRPWPGRGRGTGRFLEAGGRVHYGYYTGARLKVEAAECPGVIWPGKARLPGRQRNMDQWTAD